MVAGNIVSDNGRIGNDQIKTAAVNGNKIATATLAGTALKTATVTNTQIKTATIAAAKIATNVITNNQLKFFFTKVSTGKNSRTFAHGLGATPKIVIAQSLTGAANKSGVWTYTFGATNVIVKNASFTTTVVILAM